MLEESSTVEVTRAEMMSNTEEVMASTTLEARTFTLACLSGKGGEDNARVELKVGSNDDDIDFETRPIWTRKRKLLLRISPEGTKIRISSFSFFLSEKINSKLALRQAGDLVVFIDHKDKDIDGLVGLSQNLGMHVSFIDDTFTRHVNFERKMEDVEGYPQQYEESADMLKSGMIAFISYLLMF
ncbi:hypothetical protein ACFE04_022385 [Oxalis oulophora]